MPSRKKNKSPVADLMTVAMAAKESRYSIPGIYRAIERGDLKAYPLGKILLITRKDFIHWFKGKT